MCDDYIFREHVRGERGTCRPVDQRTRYTRISRRHPGRTTGLASSVPIPVVPIHPLLSGYGANHGRSGCRELRSTLLDARVLRQINRDKNHYTSVRHMDRQFDPGHVTVHLQVRTRLLCQKGSKSTYMIYYSHTLQSVIKGIMR